MHVIVYDCIVMVRKFPTSELLAQNTPNSLLKLNKFLFIYGYINETNCSKQCLGCTPP